MATSCIESIGSQFLNASRDNYVYYTNPPFDLHCFQFMFCTAPTYHSNVHSPDQKNNMNHAMERLRGS